MKDVAYGKLRKLAQNRHKPCDHEKRILWPLFDQNKNLLPQQCGGWTDPKKFSDRFWYMERRNRSSYAKTRPVLRICSELEDKTGTIISNSPFQIVNYLNWKSCQLQSFITFRDLQFSFWLFLHPRWFTKFEF